MSHDVILANFTDQGIKNVRDSPKRAEDKTMTDEILRHLRIK